MVAVEGEVRAVGGNLVACQKRRIIRIIPGAGFKLGEVILAGLATAEERSEEGAGRIVLNIDLDANGREVLLEDQFVILTPQVVGCGRVLELQPLPVLAANAVRSLDPAVRIEQLVRGGGIEPGTG